LTGNGFEITGQNAEPVDGFGLRKGNLGWVLRAFLDSSMVSRYFKIKPNKTLLMFVVYTTVNYDNLKLF